MTSSARSRLGWLGALLAAGACASTKTPALDAAADASADAAADASADAAPDAAVEAPPDFALPPAALPLPPGAPVPRRLFDGRSMLTGYGLTSCSHQEPASGNGDRWCVFMAPGKVDADAAPTSHPPKELWVIDVTRAATEPIACDGTSPGCLRLTTNLWTGIALGGPSHPYDHAFAGDTLIFYADATSPLDQLHRGPVYAWRPGWAQARKISSDSAVMCWGHTRLPIAHCLDDITGDVLMPDSITLRAGPIADVDGQTLPSIGSIRPSRPGNVSAWQAGFSPAGDVFVVSSPDPDPQIESVRVVPTAMLGQAAPTEILRDGTSWEIAPDGHTFYFYRAEAIGRALYAADFPSGANPRKLGAMVTDFRLLGDASKSAGLVFLTEPNPDQHVLHLLRDVAQPASAVTLFTSNTMLEEVEISPDARFTAWSNEHFDMRIVRHDSLDSCYLNTSPAHDAFAPWFTDSARMIFWREDAPEDSNRLDGYLADPATCLGKRRYATGIEFTYPIGDRGLVFGDELDDHTSTVALKYAPLAAGSTWPAAPVKIADWVARGSLVLVGQRPLMLLYTIAPGGTTPDGTYLFGPVPF